MGLGSDALTPGPSPSRGVDEAGSLVGLGEGCLSMTNRRVSVP